LNVAKTSVNGDADEELAGADGDAVDGAAVVALGLFAAGSAHADANAAAASTKTPRYFICIISPLLKVMRG